MRILLIVLPERFDFYNYLSAAGADIEWTLLWYEKEGQMTVLPEDLPIAFERIAYWTEFSTPAQLLKQLRPDRIIFFEIIDLRQIALIVQASRNGIPTFYLEHGAAGHKETAISRWSDITFTGHKAPYLMKRMTTALPYVIRSKFFYYSVLSGFRSAGSYRKYFLLPFKMIKGAPNKVLAHNLFRERVPLRSIVFNEANFEEYATYTGIDHKDADLTGVPFFDKYYRPEISSKDYVVYIEHPYYEENLQGWTKEHHSKIAETLFRFAELKGIPVFIKLHPRSNRRLWNDYHIPSLVNIVQAGDFTELYLGAKLILGFSSSLINGFLCAKKNVVLLGWHPQPKIFGADFSTTGLCHVSFSPEELDQQFEAWASHNQTLEKEEGYQAFLKKFNHPFDGKATSRVIETIVRNGANR
jgi:hypothetical protein